MSVDPQTELETRHRRLAMRVGASARWAVVLAVLLAAAALVGRLLRMESLSRVLDAWPEAKAMAFLCASSINRASFPAQRTSAGPEDSQKPMPNFMPGTVSTIAS